MSLLMQAPLDAAYGAFGVAATYTAPGGSPVGCTIVVDLEDRTVAFGDARPFGEGIIVRVRASEIAAPARGGQFAYEDLIKTIIGDPQTEDPERLEWTCRVA